MNELILIAEDEPEIAKILDAYLVREGYRTVNAADGQTALDQHAILKPDLVLLDVKMPKIDGWDVLAELRRRGETPIIMITALDQDLDRLQGLRLGADDYVVKPFNPLEVVARAKAVLRRSGYAKSNASPHRKPGDRS
nr:pseudogene-two-component transcriptional regulator, winged helix family [Rhodopseudomonas palustris CGA009]